MEGKIIENYLFKTGGIIAFFVVLLAAETVLPLRRRRLPRMRRYQVNAGLAILALAAGAVVVRPVGLRLAALSSERSLGLLHLLSLPGWITFAAGFLLMDLTFYYWHRFNHTVPILWRFHSVHHIDPDLDVTTSQRFHFGEILLSTLFRTFQVLLLGIVPLTYVVYETSFTLAVLFHHSNLRMPVGVERRLNRLLVTPRMHGIHHSVVRSELNSNYSAIFQFWDALNRSLVLNVPQSIITMGVGRYQRPGDNGFLNQVLLPFGRFPGERPPGPLRFGKENAGVMAE